MRINSLTIENFRCFRGTTTIDLSADVVVIYGRNGVGKTAVFDAIELGLMGQIGRFDETLDNPFLYLANVTEQKVPRVRIDFANGAPDYVMVSVRDSAEGSTLEGSRSWNSRRDFLYDFLVTEDYVPARREVDSLRALFRASQLLSQSSIQTFVDCEPGERSRMLTLLTGAASLQRYVEKLDDVQKLASRRVDQAKLEIKKLEMDEVPLKHALTAADERRSILLSELNSRLVDMKTVEAALRSAEIEISFQDEDQKEVFIAAAKAACREIRGSLSQRSQGLAELQSIAQGHSDRCDQKIVLTRRLDELRDVLRRLDREETGLIGTTAARRRLIAKLNANLLELGETHSSLRELPTLQTAVSESEREFRETSSKQRGDLEELSSLKRQLKALSSKLLSEEGEIQKSQDRVSELGTKLAALEQIRTQLPQFDSDTSDVLRMNVRLVALNEERKKLSPIIDSLREQKRVAEQEAAASSAEQSRLSERSDYKKQLVARLREYVSDEKCPLCGHPHSSLEELTEAITLQLTGTSADILNIAERIETDNTRVQNVTDQLHAQQEQLIACEKELSELTYAIEMASARIRQGELGAARLNCRMDSSSIEEVIKQTQEDFSNCERRFNEATAHRPEISRQIDSLEIDKKQLESQTAAQEEFIRSANTAIQGYRNRIAELGLSDAVKWPVIKAREELDLVAEKLDAAQKAKDKAANELSDLEQRLELIRGDRRDLEESQKEHEARFTNVIGQIEETMQLCRQLNVSNINPQEAVMAEREQLDRRLMAITAAENLAEQYISSKRVEDLATEVESSQARLDEIQKEILAKSEELGQTDKAIEHVEIWSKMVRKAASTIVENEIRAHQPEVTRLFKTMIPSPYLFEDLIMQRTEQGLSLGLKYRNQVREPGEPKLFLSSAQANVLALAIFLSFACTQRWSNLQSVLLDDPVQHLDDLDAVSFLDNLRAVALGRYGPKKQIILSTCDQNLYLLMIRKFRLIKADGLKFCGLSLLERGYYAPEVVYDIGGPGSADLAYAS